MKSWTLINKLKNLSKKLMILKKRLEISNENDHLGLVISKNHKSFMFLIMIFEILIIIFI